MSLITDFRYAFRSLARAKGLAITVVVTLALGIGANAAIFSVVRGVLLRPLVNRDEDRLIYIRQSAQGLGQDSVVFSVPEIQDLRARVTTLTAFGEFSTIAFTMVGLGEPRVVRAGVVNGSYFDVMGLKPVARPPARPGRRRPERRRRGGADASVLDHHAERRPVGDRQDGAVRRAHRPPSSACSSRRCPTRPKRRSSPTSSPARTISTATMVTGRVHRMTELFGRLRPGANLEAARAELRGGARRDGQGPPRVVSEEGRLPHRRRAAARPDRLAGPDGAARAAGRLRARLHHRVLERRQPDPGAVGAAGRRAGDSRDARRERRGAAAHAAGREPAAVRRRRDPRRRCWRGRWWRCWRATPRASPSARST